MPGRKKGWKHTEETKRKIGLGNLGKKHTAETKAKNGERHRGKKVSEEVRAKMSATHLKIAKYGVAHPRWKGGDEETDFFKNFKHLGIRRDEVSSFILKRHSGKCEICGRLPEGKGPAKSLHFDHDHKTLKIRGMLCTKCNTGLGLFNDDLVLLQFAIDYLRAYS
jgi:Recombination endonuclease VII/NUMOD3 motif